MGTLNQPKTKIFIIMKKIILLFLLFTSFFSYSQLALEGFETTTTSLPTGWNQYSEEDGVQVFQILSGSAVICQGTKAVEINRENTGAGSTYRDHLVTPQFTVPANGQLRFTSRQNFLGDNLSVYTLKISTNSDPSLLSAYTTLPSGTYTELQMNTNPTVCQEQKLDIPLSYVGQQVYLAFVREVIQPTNTIVGDRWILDDISVVSKCLPSSNLVFTNTSSTGFTVSWTSPAGVTSWEVSYRVLGGDPMYLTQTSLTNSITLTGLIPNKQYEVFVASVCGPNNKSEPTPVSLWLTYPLGTQCQGAIPVTTLPYTNTNNTGLFQNLTSVAQGAGCGAVPAGTNYMAGSDVFYTYTNTGAISELISIKSTPATPTSINSSLFVYGSCPVGGACLAGVANNNSQVRLISNFQVNAGQTIIIVISSAIATSTVGYTLVIQKETCTPPVNVEVTGIDLDSAILQWTNPTAATSWEVSVQPLNSGLPTAGSTTVITTANNPYTTPDNLNSGTQYEYYVRSECAPGIFSSWSGPYPFNTVICEEVNKCNYTFRMTDSGNNGWQGAKMQVRQNGIVVGEIGPTYTTANGAGPVDVILALCNNVPFDLFWSVAGTAQAQCRVAIINSFGQTLYTKAAGVSGVNQIVYAGQVDCITPVCNIAPITVAITPGTITTSGATVTWVAPATSSWDIFYQAAGQPAPTPISVPQFNDVTLTSSPAVTATGTDPVVFSYVISGLDPDTPYDVYVRVNCLPTDSNWSTPLANFTTLPTCVKPTNPIAATAISTTGAMFSWSSTSATEFQMLFIASQTPPIPPTLATVPTYTNITTTSFSPTDLLPATIYYAYVRGVCSSTNISTWVPFAVFNTLRCNATEQCNYKFVLTNTSGNSWNGARMQVRQNGIIVTTLGATASTINNVAGVLVGLCPGVPFDLFWSVPGSVPENIGVSIQNPFLDVLYTKAPGVGSAPTILYNSIGNCTPAACSKPTLMSAVPSSTSAILSWTDISTPTAESYDLYVVPTGGPAPINDPATAPTISGVSNNYTINFLNGSTSLPLLTPSTSYTYYVRSNCGAGVFSTWTVLTPTTFVTKPINDECLLATPITVNTGQVCLSGNNASGNTFGATASLPILTPPLTGTGCGQTNRDVWYKFIATSVSQSITISNIVPTPSTATVNLNFGVFSGNCDNLTKILCSTTNSINVPGLTIGDTYFIRVYNTAVAPTTFATFNICITSPPINDNCLGAINAAVNPLWECNSSLNTPGNTLGATASLPTITGAGCGTTDDDIWFSFTALNTTQIINLNDIVVSPATATVTLNHMLLSGPCDNLIKIYCSTSTQSVATNLVVNQVYYIRVYTSGTTVGSSASFNLCIGTPPPPATNDDCLTSINVPVNILADCNLTTPGNIIGATASLPALSTNPTASPCTGTPNDDVWFNFIANSGTEIISLQNIQGTTQNLNFAIYSGTCTNLTRLYCSAANSLSLVAKNLVVNNTYFIRVWSNAATTQVVTFDVCVKPVSSCQNAAPFCGSSLTNPYIYPNTTGLPDTTQVACLFSIPNPTFYTLLVDQTGTLIFNILQSESFDPAGNPQGATLDVDFVAWGPFSSTAACNQIVFGPCTPIPCPNNTTNPTFYPTGNIVDCSYSASFTETLTIPNAVAGQYYIILVTNFSDDPGFIRLVQTNFGAPTSGSTVCCDVNLGPDINACATSVTLNALEDVIDLNNVPGEGSYQWFLNPSTTPIPNANQSTYVATQSGTYKVKGACGLNPVDDEIVVVLTPPISVNSPSDYRICDDSSNDGIGQFDLQTITSQVLGTLNPILYNVTYHVSQTDANNDAGALTITSPFTNGTPNTQTIYIRVETISLTTCFAVIPVNLQVIPLPANPFIADVKECALDPLQTLLPVVPAGVDIEWFDAPTGGNVVIDPSWNQIGAATFYAETIVPNLDFVNTNVVTITIPAGQTTGTFMVPTLADTTTELTETFNVLGTITSGNTINTSSPSIAVINDTVAERIVTVSQPLTLEGNPAIFNISLSNPSTVATDIMIETSILTADLTDFTPPAVTTITIPAGQTNISVNIPTLVDAIVEIDEQFEFKATVTSGNTTNTIVIANAIITETFTQPSLIVYGSNSVEGNDAIFNLSLTAPSSVDTVIVFNTSSGSAGSLGCRSAIRTPVVLEIYPLPLAPVYNNNDITECALNPIQTLTAVVTAQPNTSIVWYDVPSGGLPLSVAPTLNTPTSIDYYAESVADGTLCKSTTRTKVTLTINPTPAAPTTLNAVDRQCQLVPIQTILPTAQVSPGETLHWFDAPIGGTEIFNPSLSIVDSVDFYAESQFGVGPNICYSPTRTKVTLEIYPLPLAPIYNNNDITECALNPIQTLTAVVTAQPNTSIDWYDVPSGGLPLSVAPTLNTPTSIDYYAESVADGTLCKSTTRTKVTLTINPTPASSNYFKCC